MRQRWPRALKSHKSCWGEGCRKMWSHWWQFCGRFLKEVAFKLSQKTIVVNRSIYRQKGRFHFIQLFFGLFVFFWVPVRKILNERVKSWTFSLHPLGAGGWGPGTGPGHPCHCPQPGHGEVLAVGNLEGWSWTLLPGDTNSWVVCPLPGPCDGKACVWHVLTSWRWGHGAVPQHGGTWPSAYLHRQGKWLCPVPPAPSLVMSLGSMPLL